MTLEAIPPKKKAINPSQIDSFFSLITPFLKTQHRQQETAMIKNKEMREPENPSADQTNQTIAQSPQLPQAPQPPKLPETPDEARQEFSAIKTALIGPQPEWCLPNVNDKAKASQQKIDDAALTRSCPVIVG